MKVFTMKDPTLRHLDMSDDDWDQAMQDVHQAIQSMPTQELRAKAFDCVEKSLFKGGRSDA